MGSTGLTPIPQGGTAVSLCAVSSGQTLKVPLEFLTDVKSSGSKVMVEYGFQREFIPQLWQHITAFLNHTFPKRMILSAMKHIDLFCRPHTFFFLQCS